MSARQHGARGGPSRAGRRRRHGGCLQPRCPSRGRVIMGIEGMGMRFEPNVDGFEPNVARDFEPNVALEPNVAFEPNVAGFEPNVARSFEPNVAGFEPNVAGVADPMAAFRIRDAFSSRLGAHVESDAPTVLAG